MGRNIYEQPFCSIENEILNLLDFTILESLADFLESTKIGGEILE
jgi:hypothetical protein